MSLKAVKHLLEKAENLSAEERWQFKFADDMESDHEVITRFLTKLREIAAAYPKKAVLVVTHGGCIRNFLMHIGYAKHSELGPGTFTNAGYIKVLSDGVDFFIKEVKGLKKKDGSK